MVCEIRGCLDVVWVAALASFIGAWAFLLFGMAFNNPTSIKAGLIMFVVGLGGTMRGLIMELTLKNCLLAACDVVLMISVGLFFMGIILNNARLMVGGAVLLIIGVSAAIGIESLIISKEA